MKKLGGTNMLQFVSWVTIRLQACHKCIDCEVSIYSKAISWTALNPAIKHMKMSKNSNDDRTASMSWFFFIMEQGPNHFNWWWFVQQFEWVQLTFCALRGKCYNHLRWSHLWILCSSLYRDLIRTKYWTVLFNINKTFREIGQCNETQSHPIGVDENVPWGSCPQPIRSPHQLLSATTSQNSCASPCDLYVRHTITSPSRVWMNTSSNLKRVLITTDCRKPCRSVKRSGLPRDVALG